MRIYKKYAPRQIAKHVSAFFKGSFYIEGEGEFTFDGGRVIMPDSATAAKKKICSEINNLIRAFVKQRSMSI